MGTILQKHLEWDDNEEVCEHSHKNAIRTMWEEMEELKIGLSFPRKN